MIAEEEVEGTLTSTIATPARTASSRGLPAQRGAFSQRRNALREVASLGGDTHIPLMAEAFRAIGRGMAAGAAATVAMSGVMLVAKRLGLMGKMPPKKITQAAFDAAGIDRSSFADDAWATVAHFAYGIGCGGVFGLLEAQLRPPLPAPVSGALFGTAVWAVSYVGWVPALGILPTPPHDRRGRPASMIFAHLAFGGVLGALTAARRA